jgi:hypothetical protein
MYIADAFGYLGSVLVLFIKEFIGINSSWISFFMNAVLLISLFGIAGTIVSAIYFRKKYSSLQSTFEKSYGR